MGKLVFPQPPTPFLSFCRLSFSYIGLSCSLKSLATVLPQGLCKFFFKCLCIYLAVLGLSCSMQDLHCIMQDRSLQHTDLVACEILVPRPGSNLCPLAWKVDSWPLDHQGSSRPFVLALLCLCLPCPSLFFSMHLSQFEIYLINFIVYFLQRQGEFLKSSSRLRPSPRTVHGT